jgi:hypothetical protein
MSHVVVRSASPDTQASRAYNLPSRNYHRWMSLPPRCMLLSLLLWTLVRNHHHNLPPFTGTAQLT